MNAMDVWSDDDFREEIFNDCGQANVGMMKLNDGKKNTFVNDDFRKMNSEGEDQRDAN